MHGIVAIHTSAINTGSMQLVHMPCTSASISLHTAPQSLMDEDREAQVLLKQVAKSSVVAVGWGYWKWSGQSVDQEMEEEERCVDDKEIFNPQMAHGLLLPIGTLPGEGKCMRSAEKAGGLQLHTISVRSAVFAPAIYKTV
jgi:hypothetical protein